MKSLLLACMLLPVQSLLLNSFAIAQPMVYTTTPLQTNGDRFFESTNMSWSLRGSNSFATFGGPNIGVPRFGSYNPNAGLSSGWAFNSGKFSGDFRFNFSQGFERFSTTTTPSVMTTNGQPGYFFSGVRTPFVYSLVPVVPPGGAFFTAPDPAFHQQLQQPATIAERVLRGDILLPKSHSAPHPVAGSGNPPGTAAPADPTVARTNAAFSWFQDNSQRHISVANQHPAVPVTNLQPDLPPKHQTTNALTTDELTDAGKPRVASASSREVSASQRIAEVYFERGLTAESQGDTTTAAFLFRMAAERATGKLKDQIDQKTQSLISN
ncbi:MAG: hypothetical protein O3B13_00460 [Planctomycetota bacterium]|nr:hypothetical protein [Planctomycetota bacterium]